MPRFRRRRGFRRSRGGIGLGRRKAAIGKLVNGRVPLSMPERMLKAGAPYMKVIPALAKGIGRLSSIINSELHYLDTTAAPSVSSSGTISLLTGVAIGDTDITREGNKVMSHDLNVRFHCYLHASATVSQIRLMIVCDKECDGAVFTVANLLQVVGPLSPLNQDYSKRFVILYDKMITLDTSGQRNRTWKKYIKTPFHIHYIS